MIIEEWISKADEDFEFAQINFKEEKPFHAQICFHFQQAAEKYLKAYIIANELEFTKIHDLSVLLNQCEKNDASFKKLIDECEYLTAFYIETRYPVHWPVHLTRQQTEKAYNAAKNIRSFTKQKLKMP